MLKADATRRTARRATRADWLLIAALAVLGVLPLLYRGHGRPAVATEARVVSLAGDPVLLPLDSDRSIRVQGPLGFSIVEAAAGRVRMKSSPCPNQLCVRQGWVSRNGDIIVCAPNRIGITVQGPGALDAIAR